MFINCIFILYLHIADSVGGGREGGELGGETGDDDDKDAVSSVYSDRNNVEELMYGVRCWQQSS